MTDHPTLLDDLATLLATCQTSSLTDTAHASYDRVKVHLDLRQPWHHRENFLVMLMTKLREIPSGETLMPVRHSAEGVWVQDGRDPNERDGFTHYWRRDAR